MVNNPTTVPPNSYKVTTNVGTPEEKVVYRQTTKSGYADIDPNTGKVITVVSTQKTATGEKKVNVTSFGSTGSQTSSTSNTSSNGTSNVQGQEAIAKATSNLPSSIKLSKIQGKQDLYKEVAPAFPSTLSREIYIKPQQTFISSGYETTPKQDIEMIKRSEDYRVIGEPAKRETLVSKGVSQVKSGYELVNVQLSNILTSNPDIQAGLSPLKKAFTTEPSKSSKVLVDINLGSAKELGIVPRGIEKGATYVKERPLDVYSSALGGEAFSKVASKIPSVTFASKTIGSSKVKAGLGLGLGTAYGVSAVKGYAEAQDKEQFVISEGIKLGAFGLGAKLPQKVSVKSILIGRKSIPSVERVEAIKSVSTVEDFGGNILELQGGKPEILAGKFTSKGGGLYKVDSKFYKLNFEEQGKYVNLPSGKILSTSEANLNIKGFGYKIKGVDTKMFKFRYEPVQLSQSKASMVSKSILTPSDESFKIASLSKIISGRGITRRFTKGTITPKNEDFVFKGVSADVTNKFKQVRGSEQLVASRSKLLTEVSTPESTKSSYLNINVGKDVGALKKSIGKDFKSNVAKFNKEQFVGGSEQLLGLKTVKKVDIQPQITESTLKNVALKQFMKEQKQFVSSQKYYRAKGSPIAQPSTKLEYKKPSLNVRPSSLSLKSSVKSISRTESKLGQGLKSGTSLRQSTSNLLKQSSKSLFKQRSDLRPDVSLKAGTSVRQDASSKTASALKLKQLQKSKLTQLQDTKLISPLTLRTSKVSYGGFKLPKVNEVKGTSRKSFKSFKPSTPKFKYEPTIEASYFKIRGKELKGQAAKSGLFLRPIAVGV